MKIAIIAPLAIRVPPRKYGGAEFVVYYLTEELVKRGHKVDLYATGDSITSANLIPVIKQGIWESNIVKDSTSIYLNMIYELAQKKKQYDIIHDHMGPISTVLNKIIKTPVVSTLHVPLNQFRDKLFRNLNNFHLVSISNNQRKVCPDLKYAATVYNGIPYQQYRLNLKPKNYLFFLGRFDEIKGSYEAIKVALGTHHQLIMAAKIEDEDYYNKKIKSYIDGKKIKYIGEADFREKNKLLGNAKALLVPINWEEPFGLVVPEANSCGTPVIAFARGSMPELIKDGYNGFLIKPGDVKAMAKAVQRIYDMPEKEYLKLRQNCRKHVEENFTIEKMVDGYEKVYQQIINK